MKSNKMLFVGCFGVFALLFTGISIYCLFAICSIYLLQNFISSLLAFIVNIICIMSAFVICSKDDFKVPMKVSYIVITALYALINVAFICIGSALIPHSIFSLINMLLFFAYIVFILPVAIAGFKK